MRGNRQVPENLNRFPELHLSLTLWLCKCHAGVCTSNGLMRMPLALILFVAFTLLSFTVADESLLASQPGVARAGRGGGLEPVPP